MNLEITNTSTLAEVQRDFNALYPYLKLEFFAKAITRNGNVTKKTIKNPRATFKEARTNQLDTHITISPNLTVAAFEKRFVDTYGFVAAVLRQSGRGWIETGTQTAEWTLEKQNAEGKAVSNYPQNGNDSTNFSASPGAPPQAR